MWSGIGIIKYLINIHKIWHKFAKKWNKCDVTIKSIITKITINHNKKGSWNNKKIHQKRNKIRERESIDLFGNKKPLLLSYFFFCFGIKQRHIWSFCDFFSLFWDLGIFLSVVVDDWKWIAFFFVGFLCGFRLLI